MKVEILIGSITEITCSGNRISNHYQLLPIGREDGGYYSFKTEQHDRVRLIETLSAFVRDIKDSASGIVEYSIENGVSALNGKEKYAIDPMSDEDVKIFVKLLERYLAR